MPKAKKSVIFLDQYSSFGGGQRVLLQVVRALKKAGNFNTQPPVFALPLGGRLQRALQAEFGAEAQFISTRELVLQSGTKGMIDLLKWMSFSVHTFLRLYFRANQFGCIYVNGGRLYLVGAAVSLLRGIPAIYHVHLNYGRFEKYLIFWLLKLRATSAVVVASDFIREELVKAFPALNENSKLKVIENALSPQFSDLPWENRFQDKSKSLRMVCVGLLCRDKGQDLAIKVAQMHPELEVHFFGRNAPGSEEWIRQLKETATDNVVFHGEVEDLPRAIRQLRAHFSLVPSRWDEPFGLVAIESMACSCITLLSGKGGLRSIADKTGAFVFNDELSLHQIVGSLLGKPIEELAAVSQSQHDQVMSQYATERFDTRIALLFQ